MHSRWTRRCTAGQAKLPSSPTSLSPVMVSFHGGVNGLLLEPMPFSSSPSSKKDEEAGPTRGVGMAQLPSRPVDRRQLLLKKEPPACAHFPEVAGGTTAECVAVCCCCPCGLVNLLVLAVVRLPVGLCRSAMKKKKKRRVPGKKKPGLLQERKREGAVLSQVYPAPPKSALPVALPDPLPKTEVSPMDDEEWVKLYTGFWRNPSERE